MDLNIKYRTIKLLGEILEDLVLGKVVLPLTPTVSYVKGKIIDKIDLIEISNFCSAEDSVKRMKRQATEGRKYLQNI